MSRLWPDNLLCVLSPRHLALVRSPLFGRAAGQNYSRPLTADEDDYQEVLAAFDQALSQLPEGQARLKLVLAGALARHALTTPVTALLSVDEEAALAGQTFARRFGDASRDWTVRYMVQGLGEPLFCSAVPSVLLEGLKKSCDACGVQLASVESLLAIAWRKARKQLPRNAGWLAVAEPGRVHLASLHNRAWLNLASARTHGDWEGALATLLQREASVLGRNEDEPVWLMGAEPGMTLPAARPWRWALPPQGDTPYLDLVTG